jgi:uncharacterized protein (DUF4415 family)
MKKEYDFSRGTRGPVIGKASGKTRITIRIDDDILDWFRAQVHASGGGSYQKMINTALRQYVQSTSESLANTLRVVVREELAKYGKKIKPR